MIRLKPMNTQAEWDWFRKRTSVVPSLDEFGIIGVDEKGLAAGAVVFDTITPEAMNVHLAVENPAVLRRGLLNIAARVAFDDMDKKRLFGLVPDNNERALKMNNHIGFREVTRVPDAIVEGVGIVIMRIDRDGAGQRWLETKMEEAA